MKNIYDVIIVGGSYSGLSAAMALGRTLRKVLIIDSGLPCNRNTPHSHNFLTHDGETPAAIAAKAKEQVLQYPCVEFLHDKAITAEQSGNVFTIRTETGSSYSSGKLLFATGVTDIMTAIDGFNECWGISVIHCPYCHGYEVKGKRTVILANGDAAMHYAILLKQMTPDLTIFTNGPALFTCAQFSKLAEHEIAVKESSIIKLSHNEGYINSIVLEDETTFSCDVVYSRPEMKQHTNLPEQLGCSINDQGFIVIDEMQQTTVTGVYATGDCTTGQRAVAIAVAGGMKAGAAINYALCGETF